jgi:beta-lactam-binding protein with PASTA domain/tRNA A-37 threonylcarbamoyl transferase component Bud32
MPSIADAIGRVLGDRYRLVTPVGTGASAHVYLAEDVTLDRRVAIKLLHPALAGDAAFLKRFRAEARAVAALNHPNVLQVYDWGEQDGQPYLVTEFLAGGSLRQLLDAGGRLTPSQAVHVGLEATAALDYAHRRGIVHRDVKPANLLFDADGRLRIADFGVARALAEAAWTEPEGALLGTARYAAPEQAEGLALDGKADVYGLALVLVEAVTGSVPFVGDTTLSTLMARVGALLPEHPALGPLHDVLMWAAAPDPDERFDAAALGVRLQALAVALPPAGPLPLAGTATGDLGPAARGLVTAWAPVGAAGLADATELGAPPLAPGRSGRTTSGTVRRDVGAPPPLPGRAGGRGWPGRADAIPGPAVQRRRRWPKVLAVLALVAAVVAGGAVYAVRTQLFVPSHPVPDLVGRSIAGAERATAGDHFRVVGRSTAYSITVPAGRIVSQRPAASTAAHRVTAKQGATIVVVVSKGKPPVTIPDLTTYSSCKDAVKALAALHLVGTCPASAAQYSSSVPAGGIVGTSPTGHAPYGSTVVIVTSKGHAPVVVPAVATGSGSTYAAAKAALAAAGFVVTEHHVYSSTVPADAVVGTTPDATAGPQPFGSTVTVDVSLGPQPVPVPNVVGDTVGQATAALQAQGLVVGNVYGPAGGHVFLTDPGQGTTELPGTAVTLYTI